MALREGVAPRWEPEKFVGCHLDTLASGDGLAPDRAGAVCGCCDAGDAPTRTVPNESSVTVDDSGESRTRQPARKSDRIDHSCAQVARPGSGEDPDAAWRPTVFRVIVPPQERPLAAATATFAVATLRFVTTTSRGAFFRGIIGRP